MRLVFYILFIIGGCLWLLIFIKFLFVFNKFNDYLFAINDKDTLRKIGGLNSMGQRRLAGVPFIKVHRTLLNKYSETNNERYLTFFIKYKSFSNKLVVLSVILFMVYIIYQMIIYTVAEVQ
jgi:hypothetical protein